MRLTTLLAASLLLACLPTTVGANQDCWYAIAFCSADKTEAEAFLSKGWGKLFWGLKPGQWCVATGPQSRTSARRDRFDAIHSGVSAATHLRNHCTDATSV